MNRTLLPLVLGTALALAAATSSRAAIIFDTYAGNDAGAASTISDANGKAIAFTMPSLLQPTGTTSYVLDSLALRFSGSALSTDVVLSLYTNDGSNTPGTLITGFTAASAFTLSGTVGSYAFLPDSVVSLLPGTTYWVTLNTLVPTATRALSWRTSSPGPSSYSTVGVTTGGAVFGNNLPPSSWTSPSSVYNGLAVNATAVPEPATCLLVGATGTFLLLRLRRFLGR